MRHLLNMLEKNPNNQPVRTVFILCMGVGPKPRSCSAGTAEEEGLADVRRSLQIPRAGSAPEERQFWEIGDILKHNNTKNIDLSCQNPEKPQGVHLGNTTGLVLCHCTNSISEQLLIHFNEYFIQFNQISVKTITKVT